MITGTPGPGGPQCPPQRWSAGSASTSGAPRAGLSLVCSSSTCSLSPFSLVDTTNSSSFMKVEQSSLPWLMMLTFYSQKIILRFHQQPGEMEDTSREIRTSRPRFKACLDVWYSEYIIDQLQAGVLISLSMKLQKRRRKQFKEGV